MKRATSVEHRFIIEVTAISHGPVNNEENWREGVERHVAKTLLHDAGNYSAILRVNPNVRQLEEA